MSDTRPLEVDRHNGRPAATAATVVTAETGGADLVDRLTDEWRAMCRRAPAGEPFCHPEWVRAFLSAFAARQDLTLVTARASGHLVAVLPLVKQWRKVYGLPVPVLAAAANVHSCRFDLARGADLPEPTLEAIWDFLARRRGWTALIFEHVPSDGTLPKLLALAERRGFPVGSFVSMESPYFSLADVDGDWESWLSRLKGEFRREMRRRARKLAAEGHVELRYLPRADRTMLDRFYELEASGWKGAEGTAVSSNAATRRFYDDIAASAAGLGYLSLYFLEVDGRPVAGHFGLTYGGRYFVPKLAYDEKYAAVAPGQLLVSAVARHCAERGVREFDFLGPMMAWKASWTSLTRQVRTFYVFRNNLVGRALYEGIFGLKSAAGRLLRPRAGEPAAARGR